MGGPTANADIGVLETLRHEELVAFYKRYLLDTTTRAVLLVGRRSIKVPGEVRALCAARRRRRP